MRLYWLGLSSFNRFLHLVLALILLVLLLLWLLPSPAQADGYRPGQAGYKDDVRDTRYSAPRDDIRKYLTAEDKRQLKAIHRRAVARRDGRNVRNYRTVSARHDEPLPVRYVERRAAATSLYTHVSGKRCLPAIKAVSEERGWEARALRDAISKWRAAAIAEHGYAYGHYNSAKADRPDCGAIRTNKFGKDIYVCIVRARPCKDL